MREDGLGSLGFYSLAMLYFACGLGSLFSTSILKKIGVIPSIFVGCLGTTLWVYSAVFSALKAEKPELDSVIVQDWFIIMVVMVMSFVCGFNAAILWVASGEYVAECAVESNKGFYMSYFWNYYMFSQIVGNLFAAYILGNMSQVTYFIVMGSLCLVANLSFLLLRRPINI